jgi:hypothetical protein
MNENSFTTNRFFGTKTKDDAKPGNDKNAVVEPPDLSKRFRDAFRKISFQNDFADHGLARGLPTTGLMIKGAGLIGFPTASTQIAAIKSVASQAPYGLGPDTLVDLSVRNSYQIDGSCVTFTNPEWEPAIKSLAWKAANALGTNGDYVRAELYKVLLYEEGGHFKPHRDTEKLVGMFATLVVEFPSCYAGGELVVHHGGIARIFRGGGAEASQPPRASHEQYYSAHYADCEHEVRPVTAGHRLVAVYSMSWIGAGAPPSAPSVSAIHRWERPRTRGQCQCEAMYAMN